MKRLYCYCCIATTVHIAFQKLCLYSIIHLPSSLLVCPPLDRNGISVTALCCIKLSIVMWGAARSETRSQHVQHRRSTAYYRKLKFNFLFSLHIPLSYLFSSFCLSSSRPVSADPVPHSPSSQSLMALHISILSLLNSHWFNIDPHLVHLPPDPPRLMHWSTDPGIRGWKWEHWRGAVGIERRGVKKISRMSDRGNHITQKGSYV